MFCCGCQHPWFLPNEVLWKKPTSVSLGPLTEACRFLLTVPTLKVLPYYQMVVALGHCVESRLIKVIWYVLPYKVTVIPELKKTLKSSYSHHCHHCPELLSHCYPYSQPLCSNYAHQDQEARNRCSLPNHYHVTDTRIQVYMYMQQLNMKSKQQRKSTGSHLYLFFTPSLNTSTVMIVFLLRCLIF